MTDPTNLLVRVADFHLGALALLAAAAVVGWSLRQPARRLAVARGTVGALALLFILVQVPGWSLLHLTAPPRVADTAPSEATAGDSFVFAAPAWPAPDLSPRGVPEAASVTPPAPILGPPVRQPPVDWNVMGRFTAAALLATGSGIALAWLLLGWMAGRRLLTSATPASNRLQSLLAELSDGLPAVRLCVSERVAAAVALGLRRPTILLPQQLAAESSDADLRIMLAHELDHIRRGDLWLLAALRILLTALWPNPLYWALRRRVRLDQEALADAAAAEFIGRVAYAERLVGWARDLADHPLRPRLAGAAGLWEGPSQLRSRVAVLLDNRFTMLRRTTLRWRAACGVSCAVVAIAASLVTLTPAENPQSEPQAKAPAKLGSGQQMLELPVRVVDDKGKPVAGAKVTPWALGSSQGHGAWRAADERAGVGPEDVMTDEDGTAAILYPRYRDVQEKTHTTLVSLSVDHPDFAFLASLHIDVPLGNVGPYEVALTAGVPLEIRPMIDNAPADLDDVFATWSDGRSSQPGAVPEKTADGALRIPAMPPGENSVLLVKLAGDRATHFSKLTDLELVAGLPKRIDIPLRPALHIEGILSDNVPRPVGRGRVQVETLPPAGAHIDRVLWKTWVAIRPDGTFTIAGWPADERLQLIALCDGYIATSGKAPGIVKNARNSETDPFNRPQIFEPADGKRIEVAMTPLVPCVVQVVDEDDKPVAGVRVTSWPNVHWWGQGSQIYAHPLVRGVRLLRERRYWNAIDEAFPQPFQGETNGAGKLTLELPAGDERLSVVSDIYELPVFFGSRDVRVELTPGELTEAILRLQPRGTEQLGE